MRNENKRHGCLALYLWMMIVVNSVVAVMCIVVGAANSETFFRRHGWVLLFFAISSILNVVFAIAIFNWRMWGFVGCVAMSILAFGVNWMMGESVVLAIFGFLGVIVLYGVLQIGDKERTSTSLNIGAALPLMPAGATPEQIAYQRQLEEREKGLRKASRANPKGWCQLE